MILCNAKAPLNSSTSTVLDTETDICGRPAKWKDAGPNKNFFYYCDAHREALVNGPGWDGILGQNLVPLDGSEIEVSFSPSTGSFEQ